MIDEVVAAKGPVKEQINQDKTRGVRTHRATKGREPLPKRAKVPPAKKGAISNPLSGPPVRPGKSPGRAGYGSYIVGQAAKFYFEHGSSWGPEGPKTVVQHILETTDKRSVLERLKEEIKQKIHRNPHAAESPPARP